MGIKRLFNKYLWTPPLFVVFSLSALFFAGIFYAAFWLFFYGTASSPAAGEERFFLNTDFYADPLVTKNPDLSDMLAGPIISPADPSLGSRDAAVVIVEFADYVCTYCHKQETAIRGLLDRNQGELLLVWKDYPDRDPASISYQAAVAARCAGEQGKYWEYHDLLFMQNGNLDNGQLEDLAVTLGLNPDEFKACRADSAVAALVNDNIEEADALGIRGIPFIYVNDIEIMGEASLEELETLIKLARTKIK